jgi:hypothetical protein
MHIVLCMENGHKEAREEGRNNVSETVFAKLRVLHSGGGERKSVTRTRVKCRGEQ